MATQHFVFNDKGSEYFRAQTQHMRSFEAVIQYFQRQGVGRGQAINLARKTRPDDYNEWMANHRRDEPSHNGPRERQAMTLRGAPVRFQELKFFGGENLKS